MRDYSTTDINLVAALLTIGVPFKETDFFYKVKTVHGETSVFHLQDKTTCGQYKTKDLMKYWEDDNFEKINPEHPFAYIKCYHKNRNGLLDKVKSARSTMIIERDGRFLIMSEDYPQDKLEKLIGKL